MLSPLFFLIFLQMFHYGFSFTYQINGISYELQRENATMISFPLIDYFSFNTCENIGVNQTK